MMTFCKKSVHSFLGLASTMDSITTEKLPCKCHGVSALTGGLGLITATGDIHRPNNVVESSTIKSTPPSSPPAISPRKDPRGICFIDDIGGGVDGLMSCTESLGFESSDERRIDDDDEIELCSRSRSTGTVKWRKLGGERREIKKFPPPLSSLNYNGQPSFFLRPVRKDGRLELTEVRIDRPEILRAYRQDGRLRLHLIRNDCFDINEAEEEQEHEQEEIHEEQEQEQELEQEEEEESEEVKEEESVGEWRFPATGEGFRRCHELVSHHHDYHHHHHSNHHHNLHVWSQHCVTSR